MKIHSRAIWVLVLSLSAVTAGPAAGADTGAVSVRAAARFLAQSSWGPTTGSIGDVQALGFRQFLQNQFYMEPSAIPDAPDGTKNLVPLQRTFFYNAIRGEDQLRQRVAFALSELWVVSGVKLRRPEMVAPYLRLLQRDAFGNYLDLMHDVTLSPAMGHYLDMVNNDKPDPSLGKGANENYARELMQLFTIGLEQLNLDGTLRLDAAGKPVPTYDQETIEELSRVLTGWTYAPTPGIRPRKHNPPNWNAPMVPVEWNHDRDPKVLFGKFTLPAGRTAEQDLEDALGIIFEHDNLAPFVSKQLIQHLVKSNPTPGYVARAAQVFNDNGSGVRGDLRAVVQAILLDPEARAGDDPAAAAAASGGHLMEPALFITALLRALDADVPQDNNLPNFSRQMGQNVYYSPSVFNYFSPFYEPEGAGLLGPEFEINSPSIAIVRQNFVNRLAFGSLSKDITIDFDRLARMAANPDALLDQLNALLLRGGMTPEMRTVISDAMSVPAGNKMKARTAVYLAGSSQECQVIH